MEAHWTSSNDNENGLLYEPNNLEDLLFKIDKALYFKFNNMNEHIKSKFSLESKINNLTSVYDELL